jgi:hypothetical protein
MTEIAELFRRVADGLTRTIPSVPDQSWAKPSPCDGWDGRDVVDEAMRASGPFGPRLEIAADADQLTRVLAFYGRSVVYQ